MSCPPDKPISKRPRGAVAAKPPESSVTRKKGNHAIELKTLKAANETLQPEPDARLAKYGLEVEGLSRGPSTARRCVSSRLATRSGVASARIAACESFVRSASARSNTARPYHARASLSSNASNPRGRRLCQAVTRISVLVRRHWASLAVDELPGGNHRRGRAGATSGNGAYVAYKFATDGGGGWRPGHTGSIGAAHRSRPFAVLRKAQPASPSACRADASCEDLHSM
jgi:hypothetical protein